MKIKNEAIKTVLVMFGLLALFIGCVLVPYGFRDAQLRERVEAARQSLGIGEVDNAGLARLYSEVQNLRARQEGYGQYVPAEAELSLVLQDLSKLINQSGVTGQDFITSKPAYYADYNILPVKIQFNAPFATAFGLVKRIEVLSRVVRIDRLDIEATPKYPRQPLTVRLELSAFFAAEMTGGAP